MQTAEKTRDMQKIADVDGEIEAYETLDATA